MYCLIEKKLQLLHHVLTSCSIFFIKNNTSKLHKKNIFQIWKHGTWCNVFFVEKNCYISSIKKLWGNSTGSPPFSFLFQLIPVLQTLTPFLFGSSPPLSPPPPPHRRGCGSHASPPRRAFVLFFLLVTENGRRHGWRDARYLQQVWIGFVFLEWITFLSIYISLLFCLVWCGYLWIIRSRVSILEFDMNFRICGLCPGFFVSFESAFEGFHWLCYLVLLCFRIQLLFTTLVNS